MALLCCVRSSLRVAAPLLKTLQGVVLLAGLAACGAPVTQVPVATGREGQRLQVVTTVLPITLLTRAVAADCAVVTALLPAGAGPHGFQASPSDLVALRRARVVIKNGLGLEPFLDKLVIAAGNPRLQVIDASADVTPLVPGEGSPLHAADQVEHRHGDANPHVWLDPLRAAQQVRAIREALVQLDPGCAAGYRRQAADLEARLVSLNRAIAAELKPYRGRTFVALHAVAPYFAERYGLKAEDLVAVPEQNPSPADLQRVEATVRRHRLRALLSEPLQNRRSFEALARDLGIGLRVFDPIETAASEQAAHDPETYFKAMRRNATQVRQVFSD